MTSIDTAFKSLVAFTAAVILYVPFVHWPYIQADPKVVACDPPYTADANLVRKTTFKAGETFYSVRNDLFQNKIAGQLQVSFIRDDGLIPPPPPPMWPPKLSPNGVCSKAMHGRTIPLNYPPGIYTYSVVMFSEKNPRDRAHATYFPPVNKIEIVAP